MVMRSRCFHFIFFIVSFLQNLPTALGMSCHSSSDLRGLPGGKPAFRHDTTNQFRAGRIMGHSAGILFCPPDVMKQSRRIDHFLLHTQALFQIPDPGQPGCIEKMSHVMFTINPLPLRLLNPA